MPGKKGSLGLNGPWAGSTHMQTCPCTHSCLSVLVQPGLLVLCRQDVVGTGFSGFPWQHAACHFSCSVPTQALLQAKGSWIWEAAGREECLKSRKDKMVTELCQCCGTDNSTRMVTSTDMPQHNKLLSAPTVAQGSLTAQLPWASLAPPVIL